ncbi:hypothetical protein TNCV_223881 [Trichonephila clavipes]|nr:hypothetical protein TNCV_223881 [Trichonephila clavipes]
MLTVALSTLQVTVRFSSVPPNFEGEHPGGGQGLPTSHPLPPTSRDDQRLDGCLEYPHAAKALNIYKHPCLLRHSNPDPTAQQSAPLITLSVVRTTNRAQPFANGSMLLKIHAVFVYTELFTQALHYRSAIGDGPHHFEIGHVTTPSSPTTPPRQWEGMYQPL